MLLSGPYNTGNSKQEVVQFRVYKWLLRSRNSVEKRRGWGNEGNEVEGLQTWHCA